jgi:hypothetical protein
MLKPEDGSEGDAQVVVRAGIEIHFIAGFEAQAHRAERGCDSGGGIEGGVEVRGAQAEDGAGNVAVREQAGAEAEIDESGLERGVRMEVAFGALQRGAEQSVSDADGSVFDGGDAAGGNVEVGFVEVDAVIVSEFAFQHDVVMDTVSEACAESEVVRAGLRDAEAVEKDAEFHALLGEGERCEQEEADQGEGAHWSGYDELPGTRVVGGIEVRNKTLNRRER